MTSNVLNNGAVVGSVMTDLQSGLCTGNFPGDFSQEDSGILIWSPRELVLPQVQNKRQFLPPLLLKKICRCGSTSHPRGTSSRIIRQEGIAREKGTFQHGTSPTNRV